MDQPPERPKKRPGASKKDESPKLAEPVLKHIETEVQSDEPQQAALDAVPRKASTDADLTSHKGEPQKLSSDAQREEKTFSIQPADPEPAEFRAKTDLHAKLEALDTPNASQNPEAVALFTETARKLDEEGLGGPTSQALRYPGLGIQPDVAQVRGESEDLKVPVKPKRRPNRRSNLSAEAASVGAEASAVETEPTPSHESDSVPTEFAKEIQPVAPEPSNTECKSHVNDVLATPEIPQLGELISKTVSRGDLDLSDPTSHPLKPLAEENEIPNVPREKPVYDLRAEMKQTDGSEDYLKKKFDEDEPSGIATTTPKKVPNASAALSSADVRASTESGKTGEDCSDVDPLDAEDSIPKEQPEEVEANIEAKPEVNAEAEKSVEEAKSQAEDANVEEVEADKAARAEKEAETAARQVIEEAKNVEKPAAVKDEPESLIDEMVAAPESVPKDETEVKTVSEPKEEVGQKAKTEINPESMESKKPERPKERPKSEKAKLERADSSKSDTYEVASDVSEKPDAPPKPAKQPKPAKPKSALASRFEAALRENKTTKPRPALKPKPRAPGSAFSSRFADLNAALSKPPQMFSEPKAPEEADDDVEGETGNMTKDSDSNETQPIDPNDSADAQLTAMPRNPRARGRGGKRRLPSSIKPSLVIVAPEVPLWEIMGAEASTEHAVDVPRVIKSTAKSNEPAENRYSSEARKPIKIEELGRREAVEGSRPSSPVSEPRILGADTELDLQQAVFKSIDAAHRGNSPMPGGDEADIEGFEAGTEPIQAEAAISDRLVKEPIRAEPLPTEPTRTENLHEPAEVDHGDSDVDPLTVDSSMANIPRVDPLAVDFGRAGSEEPGAADRDIDDLPQLGSLLDKALDAVAEDEAPVTRPRLSIHDYLAEAEPHTAAQLTPSLEINLSQYLDKSPQTLQPVGIEEELPEISLKDPTTE